MVCITKSTFYINCHFVVSSISDLSLIIKLLVEDAVFNYHPGRGNNKLEFTNLYLFGIKSITVRSLLNLYQYRVCGNEKLRLGFDGRLPTIKVGKQSDINVVKGADLLYNNKIDHDNNNNK